MQENLTTALFDIQQVSDVFAHVVRTCIGPRGSLKALKGVPPQPQQQDEQQHQQLKQPPQQPIITKHGSVIFKNVVLTHPAGTLFAKMVKSVEASVGDGTLTSVLVAAELVRGAAALVEQGYHPIVIHEEYNRALATVKQVLKEISHKICLQEEKYKICKGVCFTVLSTKLPLGVANQISKLCADTYCGRQSKAVIDSVLLLQSEGACQLIYGVVFDQVMFDCFVPKSIGYLKRRLSFQYLVKLS